MINNFSILNPTICNLRDLINHGNEIMNNCMI
ncbi:protein of unknown function [Clostridium beijerinckii]|nr:protein of unknown function [Clostridium beijerinckii]